MEGALKVALLGNYIEETSQVCVPTSCVQETSQTTLFGGPYNFCEGFLLGGRLRELKVLSTGEVGSASQLF